MNWNDELIIFLGCVVEIFLLFDYFHNFFYVKVKKFTRNIICIGVFGIIYLGNMLGNAVVNLIVVPLVLWIFVSLIFDVKLGIRIGYFISAYIVMVGVEFLYIILSETTSELLSNIGLIRVSEYAWQLLLIKFINFLVFLILKQTSTKSKKRMTNHLFGMYLIIPICTIGVMITVFYSGIDFIGHFILKEVMTVFFVCMIAGNMLLFYAFQKYTENLSENAMQQMELIYYKTELERLTKIAELNENYNEIVHNTSHYLKVIKQLAFDSKNSEICKIIEKINGKLNREDIYEYSNHKMLNAILTEYFVKAQERGIDFDIYVEPGCVLEHIQDIDLVAMLGNALDNAVLATIKKGDKASVVVRIFMQKNGKLCIIKIVNDFVEKLKILNGQLISTKTEEGIHGIGLKSISKITEKYDGYLEYYIEDKKFNTIMVLPTIYNEEVSE